MAVSCTFAQLVIGPPGSGKTTYCKAMSGFLESLGRKVAVVNIGETSMIFPVLSQPNENVEGVLAH